MRLASAHQEYERLVLRRAFHDLIARLLRERGEIALRAGIGREDLEDLAALHVGERFFRAQDGQRTVQSARIDFLVNLHRQSTFGMGQRAADRSRIGGPAPYRGSNSTAREHPPPGACPGPGGVSRAEPCRRHSSTGRPVVSASRSALPIRVASSASASVAPDALPPLTASTNACASCKKASSKRSKKVGVHSLRTPCSS